MEKLKITQCYFNLVINKIVPLNAAFRQVQTQKNEIGALAFPGGGNSMEKVGDKKKWESGVACLD